MGEQITIELPSPAETSTKSLEQTPTPYGKRWAWRLTAVYIWTVGIAAVLFNLVLFERISRLASERVLRYLSSAGFEPLNPGALWAILKVMWFLIIVDFSWGQFVGFVLYVVFFPLVVALRGLVRVFREDVATAATSKSPFYRLKLPGLTAVVLLFFCWFLLYGNSAVFRQIVPGLILAGLCFLLLAIRALQRTVKTTYLNSRFFDLGGTVGLSLIASIATRLKENQLKKKMEFTLNARVYRFLSKLYLRVALLMRGRRGASRIGMFVLAEYIVRMTALAFAAILFWALALKLASSPQAVTFGQSLYSSAAHFLPGLSGTVFRADSDPLWPHLGAACTGWILFVVYLATAANVIRLRQEAYIEVVKVQYKLFRRYHFYFRKYDMLLLRLAEKAAQKAAPAV